ncbi:hypothetical protein ACSTHG_23670, partial [Vibrio parahaemolyticus]
MSARLWHVAVTNNDDRIAAYERVQAGEFRGPPQEVQRRAGR